MACAETKEPATLPNEVAVPRERSRPHPPRPRLGSAKASEIARITLLLACAAGTWVHWREAEDGGGGAMVAWSPAELATKNPVLASTRKITVPGNSTELSWRNGEEGWQAGRQAGR